jgi:hypothetical protein
VLRTAAWSRSLRRSAKVVLPAHTGPEIASTAPRAPISDFASGTFGSACSLESGRLSLGTLQGCQAVTENAYLRGLPAGARLKRLDVFGELDTFLGSLVHAAVSV